MDGKEADVFVHKQVSYAALQLSNAALKRYIDSFVVQTQAVPMLGSPSLLYISRTYQITFSRNE